MSNTNSPRVAVLGCGYWGKNLVRNFAELDAIAMVCDATPDGRQRAQELAPKASIVQQMDEVLQSDVAGVVVATPAVTHFELGKAALLAGKDLFVEKPLALTYEQGAELVRIADEHKRILMVGHLLEYHPGIRRLVELVHDQAIGSVRYIASNRLSLGKVRREENVLWSFAPHDIAMALRITGRLPERVVATGGAFLQPTIEDVTLTQLQFSDGVRAHIYASWLNPFKEHKLVVVGSEKMVSYDDVEKKLLLYHHKVEVRDDKPAPAKGDIEEVSFPATEPLKSECQAFLDAISTRKPPLTAGQNGLDVLNVLDAAGRSLAQAGEPTPLQ